MKFTLLALLFVAQSAIALPIICESHEKSGDISTLRVKIGDLVAIRMNGNVWDKYRLGISPIGPGETRQIMYASPAPREDGINMTIVKDGFVYGYVDARSPEKNGIYDGKIRIGGILRSRIIDVQCIDEAVHGKQ